MAENPGKSKNFFLSIPLLVFVAIALLIAALQLSITNKVDRSPTGFASIISFQGTPDVDLFFDGSGELKEEYLNQVNANLDGVPEYIFRLFGSDNINIYITFDDGAIKTYNAQTSANKLVYLRKGLNDDANITVELTESVINGIMSAENPLDEFLDAFNSKEIKYSGTGVEGAVKGAGVGFAVWILGFVNGIFSFIGSVFG